MPERARGKRLVVRVQLVDWDRDKQPWDTEDAEELIQMATARKTAGNACFSAGDYARALQHYKRA